MREYHYWIYALDGDKPYLVYACPAREGENKARIKGLELLAGVDFTIKRLPTRDVGKASQMIKGSTRLPETHSLKESTRRIGHNKSLKRRLRRNDY